MLQLQLQVPSPAVLEVAERLFRNLQPDGSKKKIFSDRPGSRYLTIGWYLWSSLQKPDPRLHSQSQINASRSVLMQQQLQDQLMKKTVVNQGQNP